MNDSPTAADEKLDRIHREVVRIRILLVLLVAGMIIHFFFPAVKMWLQVLVGEALSPTVVGVVVVACAAAYFAGRRQSPNKVKTNG